MSEIRDKYPEIPTLFLSTIIACVGIDKLHWILQEYDEMKEWADANYPIFTSQKVEMNDKVKIVMDKLKITEDVK